MSKKPEATLLPVPERRSHPMSFRTTSKTKILLKKLCDIHDASVPSLIEAMVLEKSKEYGLIESRD